MGFPVGASGKESACQCRRLKSCGFNPWRRVGGKIPWSRKWHPTPIFLPGKFHGLRSLEGYGPGVTRELDTTEYAHYYSLSLTFGARRNTYLLYIPCYWNRLGPGAVALPRSLFKRQNFRPSPELLNWLCPQDRNAHWSPRNWTNTAQLRKLGPRETK